MSEPTKMTQDDKIRLLNTIIHSFTPLSKVFFDLSEIMEENIKEENDGIFYIENKKVRSDATALAKESLSDLKQMVITFLENSESSEISDEEKNFMENFYHKVINPFIDGINECTKLLGERTEDLESELEISRAMTNSFVEGTNNFSKMIEQLIEDLER